MIRMSFDKHPKLLQWAQQRNKGYQFMRHSIKLTPEVGQRLITAPALNRNEDTIRQMFFEAVTRAFA
jgi:hypothetical protein